MALIDAIETDTLQREKLLEAIQRRVAYLVARAESVFESAPKQLTAGDWRTPMVAATLWLEAFESACCVGEYHFARTLLRRASMLLLDLSLPLGAAIQRALLPEDAELGIKANEVRERWRRLPQAEPSTTTSGRGDDETADPGVVVPRAEEYPQQWAHLLLGGVAKDSAFGTNLQGRQPRFPQLSDQSPVGRMRQPMSAYLLLASFIRQGQQNRPSELDGMYQDVMAVLRDSITSVLRSVRSSQANRYLWTRALAPTPLFDLDTALLVGTAMEVTRDAKPALEDRLGVVEIPDTDRSFVAEFVGTVRALRRPRQGTKSDYRLQ